MKIAILSRGSANYSTRRLVQEAERAGHEAMVLDYLRCYMEIEEDNPQIHYDGEALRGVNAVIPRIGHSYTAYGSAVVRQFEMKGVFTTAKSIAIVRSRDKLRTMQVLSRAGVPIPKTVFASRTQDTKDLVKQVGEPPIIVKLSESTHGEGVVLAETPKAARSVIQAFHSINADILIQEFIEEAQGSDIRVFVVGGRVVAAMKRQGLDDEFRSNIHQGGTGTPIELTEQERKIALKAAKKIGLEICGVDMLRSRRGPLIIEINSSPGLEGIESASKQNIAGRIIKYVGQHAGRKQRKDKVGA